MKFDLPFLMVDTTLVDAPQRRDVASPHGRDTIVNVVAWVFLALVVSTLVTRFAVKLSRSNKRRLQPDDGLLLLAAVRASSRISSGSLLTRASCSALVRH